MGHKKGRKRKSRGQARSTEAAADTISDPLQAADPARALLAIHPRNPILAAVCGSHVRVFNRGRKTLEDLPEERHSLPVRSLCFSPCGRFLASAGDDKLVLLLDCQTWKPAFKLVAAKKISAAGFTSDGRHIMFADKFGDILVSEPLDPADSAQQAADSSGCRTLQASLLLGHYSSIVTSLVTSHDNRWLVTTDREAKVRVSRFPADPLKGAPSIQSFCFGHTVFVTCAVFIQAGKNQQQLITAGGDGAIRLWTAEEGRLLDTFWVAQHAEGVLVDKEEGEPAKEGEPAEEADPAEEGELAVEAKQQLEGAAPKATDVARLAAPAEEDEGMSSEKDEEEGEPWIFRKRFEDLPAAVLCLTACSSGGLLAAAIEGKDDVLIFHITEGKLVLKARKSLPGVRLPNSLAFDSEGALWGAGGCEGLLGFSLGAVTAIQLSADAQEEKSELCSQELRAAFGAMTDLPAAGPGGTESSRQQGLQISAELRKWVYSEEEISRRKRNRADLRGQYSQVV